VQRGESGVDLGKGRSIVDVRSCHRNSVRAAVEARAIIEARHLGGFVVGRRVLLTRIQMLSMRWVIVGRELPIRETALMPCDNARGGQGSDQQCVVWGSNILILTGRTAQSKLSTKSWVV
jgi:hypothetical protein